MSLAFQILSKAEKSEQEEVPKELEHLSSQDWEQLNSLLELLRVEKKLSKLH